MGRMKNLLSKNTGSQTTLPVYISKSISTNFHKYICQLKSCHRVFLPLPFLIEVRLRLAGLCLSSLVTGKVSWGCFPVHKVVNIVDTMHTDCLWLNLFTLVIFGQLYSKCWVLSTSIQWDGMDQPPPSWRPLFSGIVSLSQPPGDCIREAVFGRIGMGSLDSVKLCQLKPEFYPNVLPSACYGKESRPHLWQIIFICI